MNGTERSDTEHFDTLLRKFRSVSQKLSRKLEKQEEELKESRMQLWYKQIGDSLLAISPPLSRGLSEAKITNIHSKTVESVSLNPKLDSRENAQLYFKKAKRSKRGESANSKKVEMTLEEMRILREIETEIEQYNKQPDENRRAALEKRLTEFLSGYLPGENLKKEKTPYRHYTLEGWDIYIGKSDTQNDELSTRFAAPSDIWLHVAGHSGSHVVIRHSANAPYPPQEIIREAASMAVWFSKAKHCTFAEVHYTEARYVHKRRGTPAGQVILDRYKTIRVSPKSPQDLFRTSSPD